MPFASRYLAVRLGAVLVLVSSAAAARAGSVDWTFSIQSLGPDVTWTSPTAADATADLYYVTWEIASLEVRANTFLGPIWINVTSQLPPEFVQGTVAQTGPAPIVAFNQAVTFPPDAPSPAFAGNLVIGLDSQGFGYFSITDITFGIIGPPYAPIPLQLSGIRINGSVTVDYRFLCAGDLNCDGVVNFADIDLFVTALSYPGGVGWPSDCPWLNGDTSGDLDVTFEDIDGFVERIGATCE